MIAVPMMADIIRLSKRIPEDYDMSFLLVIGGGADPMHNKWLNKMQDFLQKHHSPAVFSMCYGMSEVGSAVCNPDCKQQFPKLRQRDSYAAHYHCYFCTG